MGISCHLVRLRETEVPAIRAEPIDILDYLDEDQPAGRWVDLDQAWMGLLAVFGPHDGPEDSLMRALIPDEPIFDESDSGGHTVMLAEPALVRVVADALDAFDRDAFAKRQSDGPTMDPDYLAGHFDPLRACYRQAADGGETIAVVIG